MINFPQIGSQEAIWSHDDRTWKVCNQENVSDFSAVGYFFARQLHQTLGVPVGMINNAWGGSACEAWINRDVLAQEEAAKGLMARWEGMEKTFQELSAKGSELNDDQKKQLDGLRGQMGGITDRPTSTTVYSSRILDMASRERFGIRVSPTRIVPINTENYFP